MYDYILKYKETYKGKTITERFTDPNPELTTDLALAKYDKCFRQGVVSVFLSNAEEKVSKKKKAA